MSAMEKQDSLKGVIPPKRSRPWFAPWRQEVDDSSSLCSDIVETRWTGYGSRSARLRHAQGVSGVGSRSDRRGADDERQ